MSKLSDRRHANDFDNIVAYVDTLLSQGMGEQRAIDHAVQRFGVDRPLLTDFLKERGTLFVRNSTLGTEFSGISTPSSAIGWTP